MDKQSFLKFLGTAGARFVVAKQLRASGGVFLHSRGQKILIDPGPGTLVKCASSRPPIDVTQLDAVLLTHAHIDHSNDVNILIDAMTLGGIRRRGKLFAPRECLEGEKAVVLRYLVNFLEEVVILEPVHDYTIGKIALATSVRHQHSVETYGLKFKLDVGVCSFLADTKYFPDLIPNYQGSDILVINVVRDTPFEDDEIMHLTLEDSRRIIDGVRPKKAILTHFGMTMLKAKPWELAAQMSRELGIEVIAATDGMKVDIGG